MDKEKHMKELITEFIKLLDKKEESDSGRVFSPNYISSCRVMDGQRFGYILDEFRKISKE